jgi:hypothetical protein
LSPEVVQPLTQAAEEKRGSKFIVTQGASIPMNPIHRSNGDQERDDKNDRDGEEAQDEPRAQGHFRGAYGCESYYRAVASPAPSRARGCLGLQLGSSGV